MTREQLEHIIRAAASIVDDDEIIIVGSQSVLGMYPEANPDLLVSMEADIYPKHYPERSELINGAMGELSMFHETFGYYADGVDESTPTLPDGWQDRLVEIHGPGTAGNTGWALDIHDLLVSKYVANRDKDRRYNRSALEHNLAEAKTLRERLAVSPIDEATKQRIRRQIDADAEGSTS